MAESEDEFNAKQIIENANALARRFYGRMGYVVPKGYRFDRATHPQERMCWHMVCDAAEEYFDTDLEEVLSEFEDA